MSGTTQFVTRSFDDVRASFPVRFEWRRSMSDQPRELDAVAIELGPDGLTTTLAGDLGEARHVWLEFTLPDAHETRVRALGELLGQDGRQRTVRFKHVFPDQRVRLQSYLDAQVARKAA
jgi:hypothetical protein